MLAYHKECEICGEFFRPKKHSQVTCGSPRCKKEHFKQYRRNYIRIHNSKPDSELKPEPYKRVYHKKPMALLTKDAIAARNLGLTYGQYKAKQWFKNKKGGKQNCLETT